MLSCFCKIRHCFSVESFWPQSTSDNQSWAYSPNSMYAELSMIQVISILHHPLEVPSGKSFLFCLSITRKALFPLVMRFSERERETIDAWQGSDHERETLPEYKPRNTLFWEIEIRVIVSHNSEKNLYICMMRHQSEVLFFDWKQCQVKVRDTPSSRFLLFSYLFMPKFR